MRLHVTSAVLDSIAPYALSGLFGGEDHGARTADALSIVPAVKGHVTCAHRVGGNG